MISRIFFGEAMRARGLGPNVPEPVQSHDRNCAIPFGDHACSALVTSMMTPPFSIQERPVFNRKFSRTSVVLRHKISPYFKFQVIWNREGREGEPSSPSHSEK